MSTKKPAGKAARKSSGFSEDELAAMKERAQELKKEAGRGARGKKAAADGEADVLAKIAEMTGTDRLMAERIHALVREAAPELLPKTWYGMPAYARNGQVVCFFQSAQKFKARYATFGFSDQAHLDDGAMWPTSFALKELTPVEEDRIAALVRRAAGAA